MVESAENQISLNAIDSHTNIKYIQTVYTDIIYYNIRLLEGGGCYRYTSLTILY